MGAGRLGLAVYLRLRSGSDVAGVASSHCSWKNTRQTVNSRAASPLGSVEKGTIGRGCMRFF
jgi:hypothetical protein